MRILGVPDRFLCPVSSQCVFVEKNLAARLKASKRSCHAAVVVVLDVGVRSEDTGPPPHPIPQYGRSAVTLISALVYGHQSSSRHSMCPEKLMTDGTVP